MSPGFRGHRPRLVRNVAPGVHRLEHAHVNCYLIEDAEGVTLVDTAFPATWPRLVRAFAAIGRTIDELRAVVLTHAHFDHLGMAQRVRRELGVPIWAHPKEAYTARHPYRYAHENPRALYPLQHPAAVPVLARMMLAGALRVRGIGELAGLEAGAELSVPGRPRVVFTPGHTVGHCALHLPERSTLLTGDALVTFDPYTARSGPRIVAGAATADSAQALASLDALAATDALRVLPGHGPIWRFGIRSAVREAVRAGAS